MERRKFEDSFQDAFQQAEVNPSENVWTNIELDLEKAEGGKMKRRLVFFKMLAAASVIFAMSVAGVGYYMFKDPHSNELAQRTVPNALPGQNESKENVNTTEQNGNHANESPAQQAESVQLDKNSQEALTANNDSKSSSSDAPSATRSGVNKAGVDTQDHFLSAAEDSHTVKKSKRREAADAAEVDDHESKDAVDNAPRISENYSSTFVNKNDKSKPVSTLSDGDASTTLITTNTPKGERSSDNVIKQERKLPMFYQPKQPELRLPQSTADPGMLLLAKLEAEERKYAREEKREKKNSTEKLWTSVGFAAGAFDSNNPSVSPMYSNTAYSLNATNAAAKQSKASGSAYSVGVSVGTRIAERWVLQGGVSYLTQSSDYTANGVIVGTNFEAPKAESLNAFNSQLADVSAATRVAQTYPYNVNNNVRFVSVPVQAGYLLVNKKFGLQLNAGVSTDLFLQNTITPDGGGLSKTTQGRGEESPYRSLNFSGLMGTEFSYKLGYRYRVSLNPGVRYPFSSVYKSNTGVDATPLTFDVGLRFKYIFH